MKKLLYNLFMLSALMMAVASCNSDDDEGTPEPEDPTTNRVTTNITENTTWETGKEYILGGRIAVENGATLTIQPGVVVKGELGTGANATALLVAKGGKIMAQGNAGAPIIFTTVGDEISPAQVATGIFVSPNLTTADNGLWGGVIVLGDAPISASAQSVQIEGIPTSDPSGLYGGTNSADNSGMINYISIRHGGSNIGAGNEINGLTLGGVGTGTIISNVEVVANQDDGIEWFGGTVNATNALVWNVGDDGLDTDQAWTGTMDNFVVVTPSGHNFELDGPEGTLMGGHTIKNGTVVAATLDSDGNVIRESGDLINTDSNSDVDLENINFVNVQPGQLINRTTAPNVTFTNILLDVPDADVYQYVQNTPAPTDDDGNETGPAELPANNSEIPAGIEDGTATQATISAFGWTWASQAGGLSGL